MKIEICESLITSWLKHINGCQVIEQNWKISPLWDQTIPSKDMKEVFNEVKDDFDKEDLDFISNNVGVGQMLRQGEIDCLGVVLKRTENKDNKAELVVEDLFAVEVAFHEAGLNYSSNGNLSTIRKKLIRNALTIYSVFGIKRAKIIFITPKVAKNSINDIKQVAIDVQSIFNKLGFDFIFQIYANDDFVNDILSPILSIQDKISDSNELFVRAAKLLEISGQLCPTTPPTVDTSNSITTSVTQFKIGVTVRSIFATLEQGHRTLEQEHRLTQKDINNLCDPNYCKNTFGINYPVLVPFEGKYDVAFINGYPRYFTSKIYTFNGKDYLLCSEWYEDYRTDLYKWYNAIP